MKIDRRYDSYLFETGDECELVREVEKMEQESEWFSGVASNSITLESIDGPICAEEMARKCLLDYDLTRETAETGTKLILDAGKYFLIRDTAWPTLCETAKLFGTALQRMSPYALKETLNYGLGVARGNSLVLVRNDKVSAIHSENYEVMPVSELLQISTDAIGRRFGESHFVAGMNTHGYTSAVWELPAAQERLLRIYQDAMKNAVSRQYAINFMPAVRFSTSDTARSSAFLTPCFRFRDAYFPLVDGVRVKHVKSGEKYGIELFREEADKIYAQFEESSQVISRLASTVVFHPENAVILLCKKYGVPKKYGEAAREEVATFVAMQNGNTSALTAHDVYLALTNIVTAAKRSNASVQTVNNLTEMLAKFLKCNWEEYDRGGYVEW